MILNYLQVIELSRKLETEAIVAIPKLGVVASRTPRMGIIIRRYVQPKQVEKYSTLDQMLKAHQA